MTERHPEPDLDYLKKVLLEMLAIPAPPASPTPSCAMSPNAWTNWAFPSS
jgi:hypothetical protein